MGRGAAFVTGWAPRVTSHRRSGVVPCSSASACAARITVSQTTRRSASNAERAASIGPSQSSAHMYTTFNGAAPVEEEDGTWSACGTAGLLPWTRAHAPPRDPICASRASATPA